MVDRGNVILHANAPPYVPRSAPPVACVAPAFDRLDHTAVETELRYDRATGVGTGWSTIPGVGREQKLLAHELDRPGRRCTPPKDLCISRTAQEDALRLSGAADIRIVRQHHAASLRNVSPKQPSEAVPLEVSPPVATAQHVINGQRVWLNDSAREVLQSGGRSTVDVLTSADRRYVYRVQDKARDTQRQRNRDAKLSAADVGAFLLGEALSLEDRTSSD
eukprot:TRINITY_DN18646_c0_g1_i1.p1 TRINITY_DN18646_c0_g1~~TRINITY_DN18646_c0_g1_i1.p1  ORF type:complete len:239 (+),score=27.04 TRINITY_DN18646_c0_g1_i1:60-719(+)